MWWRFLSCKIQKLFLKNIIDSCKLYMNFHISKALVLFLWMRSSHRHLSRKNPTTKHKSILFCWFLKWDVFSPLSQCAALAQASSFWQNFSHVISMELKKTEFAWFVRFQSLRLESRLENWLVTSKWLTFWNPDTVFCQMQEKEKDEFKQLYCLEVLLLLLLFRSQMKYVMWCLLVKWVRGPLRLAWRKPGEVVSMERLQGYPGIWQGRQWRGLECNSWGKVGYGIIPYQLCGF